MKKTRNFLTAALIAGATLIIPLSAEAFWGGFPFGGWDPWDSWDGPGYGYGYPGYGYGYPGYGYGGYPSYGAMGIPLMVMAVTQATVIPPMDMATLPMLLPNRLHPSQRPTNSVQPLQKKALFPGEEGFFSSYPIYGKNISKHYM